MKFLVFLTWASAMFILPIKADTVKSVYDGDTFTTSSGEKIRLACIDTPEMKNTAKKKADKPAAIMARDYLKLLIGTADLTIDRINTDFYGRTVARVYTPDGKELSREMFNSGHAQLFTNFTTPCPWTRQ